MISVGNTCMSNINHPYPAKRSREALELWADKEITETSSRLSELLRFLFGVSTTSLLVFITIAKILNLQLFAITLCSFWLAVLFFVLSSSCVLYRLLERPKAIGEKDFDINEEYNLSYERKMKTAYFCFIFWIVGIIFAAYTFIYSVS